ncbi:MAG: methylmalonyl-CoA epimerase [Calothrix sp. SM1_5_4]|nr:methylmalonyl-CoA epimerase [Calothrix sp. SM1_5_4]
MKLTFELDHIGVAVESLEKGKTFYETLGLGTMSSEHVPSEKVMTGFFELGNDARIELLEPTAPESTIAKYLAKRGPGIHHICLRVSDIRSVMKTLKAGGVQLLDDEPRRGAHNCMVCFIHPKSTGGLLIELSEPQGEHK